VNVKSLKKEERAHALNEIRLLASMQHENISAYHEAFIDGSKLVIIMEYCKHGDLSEFINKKRQRKSAMTTEAIWMYFIQICRGVQEMHQADVVHRDIKPANILRSGGGIVKLADLGVAKFLKANLAHTVIGTPYYMPPELWKQKPYDTASDVWALGCLLYEMSAFKVPFDGKSIQDLQHRICHSNPTRLPSSVPDDLRRVIDMCLKKRPSERPTVAQLLNLPVMRKYYSEVPIQIRPKYMLDERDERDDSVPPSTAGSRATNCSSVMDTIKCPIHLGQDNWRKLNQVLPAANYPLLAATHPLPGIIEEEEEVPQDKAASDPTPHRAPKPRKDEIRISEKALLAHQERKAAAERLKLMQEKKVPLGAIADGTMSHPPSSVRKPRRGRFEYLTPRGGRGIEAAPAAPPVVIQHDQYDMHGRKGGRGVNAYGGIKPSNALRDDMAAKLKGMEEAVNEVGKKDKEGRRGGLPGIKEHRKERKALVPIHPNKGFEAPWGGNAGKKRNGYGRINDGKRNARVGQGGAVVKPAVNPYSPVLAA